VWNLQRLFIKSDTPDEILDTHASVISASFHPGTAADGNTLKRFDDFDQKAKSRIWP